MLNLAILGLRHDHIFALADKARENPDVRLVGAYEADPDAARAAQKRLDLPFYPELDALLSDSDVQAVALGGCYGDRGEHAVRALRAGKHVISDKPLCTRLSELDEIECLARKTGLRVGCMLDLRYDPALRQAADIVRSGALGEIRSVAFTGQHPLNWGARPMWYFEEGKHGGTFNDIAVHGLDAVRFVTGLRYEKTDFIRQWNAFAVHAPAFADSAQMVGRLENGASLMADVSYSAPAPSAYDLPTYWRFTFWGEKGFLECKLGAGCVTLALSGDIAPRTLASPAVQGDYLTDFIREIAGESVEFGTERALEAARMALQVQREADQRKEV